MNAVKYLLILVLQWTFTAKIQAQGTCNLLPSHLGPDWYKVTRVVDDSPLNKRSYIHMPCAASTVFDEAICGCTTLMSLIFSNIEKRKDTGSQLSELPSRPGDYVKHRDPSESDSSWRSTSSPVQSSGSLLLNTRTGKIQKCPFRGSSKGLAWYLIMEPTGMWRPMKCAPGTLFDKLSCTCVHKSLVLRDPPQPDDGDIIVIDDGITDSRQSISKSLGIFAKDVDFSSRATDSDIPFWRRNDNNLDTIVRKEIVRPSMIPDVVVTVDKGTPIDKNQLDTRIDIGKDRISDEHKALLFKLQRGPIPSFKRKHHATPLSVDRKSFRGMDINDNLLSNPIDNSLEFNQKNKKSWSELTLGIDLSDTHQPNVRKEEIFKDDALIQSLGDIGLEFLGGTKNSIPNHTTDTPNASVKDVQLIDEVFLSKQECSKKALPQLGPQFFQLFIWGIGYIPYTCHGNRFYDEQLCACIQAPPGSTLNEISLTVDGCTKKALPELGARYFQTYLWGVGFIPYACHGDRIYSQTLCACISSSITLPGVK